MRPSAGPDVADIFRQYGPDYRQAHPMPLTDLWAMRAVEVCRTAVLGGHAYTYDCGHQEISYNSCRNRHCPKCQTLRKETWIESRSQDLLPVTYFHVVFSIPSELNPIVLMNKRLMYTLLFRSVAETLLQLAQNPEHLGARIGFIGILHTWGQTLVEHPHIHCIVPGGGLSIQGDRWVASRATFFIHVKVMSDLFKKKFLAYLKEHFQAGDLIFPGSISHLADPWTFKVLISRLYDKKWVVYCKPPFDGPGSVLQYLGRYTHRVAISNNRILSVKDGTVTFRWRDYADNSRTKIMTLQADEFIRRFLLHVLPPRFIRIRHFGLLANRSCKANISLCRTLLGSGTPLIKQRDIPETWQEQLLRICGVDISICPLCHKGRRHRVDILMPSRCNGPPDHRQ